MRWVAASTRRNQPRQIPPRHIWGMMIQLGMDPVKVTRSLHGNVRHEGRYLLGGRHD